MPVLSSKNFTFYSGFWLCDILEPRHLAGAIFGVQVAEEVTLDLLEKLINHEAIYSRRSLKMVKISLFIAAVVVLSACDVPFIPGI